MTKTKISSKLLKVIKENHSFLLVGHINPEGDSIGSCLALGLGLKKLGKSICVLSKDGVPENLKFLPSSKIVKQKPPRKKFDVVLLIDCNDINRTGFESFNAEKTAIIDHHVLPSDSGESAFYRSLAACHIDTGAASAGVLIFKTLTSLKVPIDKSIATSLYTSILVDTGGFRYSNVSPESLSISAKLVEAGASPWEISKELHENVPYRSMKLLGLSLATLEKKNGIAWISTSNNMIRNTDTTSQDSEGFVDYPRKIKGVEVAIFFRQNGERSYKLSLRSKGMVNVQKVANYFGGGGHVAAAGCSVKGTLKEVQGKVFKAIKKEILLNTKTQVPNNK